MEAAPVMHLGNENREARINDGWQRLANNIVLLAVHDYRHVLRYLAKYPEESAAIDYRESLEEFFLSDWFQDLCDLDGNALIQRLQSSKESSRRFFA